MRNRAFELRHLGFENVRQIVDLQAKVVDTLPDKQMYYPLSRDEIFESLHLDSLVGVYADDRLVAMAVLVNPRDGERNLAADFNLAPATAITFDVVIVDPDTRGYGLHHRFIDYAIAHARQHGAPNILATVDPDNTHSLNNFLTAGFQITDTRTKYANLRRHLLRLTL